MALEEEQRRLKAQLHLATSSAPSGAAGVVESAQGTQEEVRRLSRVHERLQEDLAAAQARVEALESDVASKVAGHTRAQAAAEQVSPFAFVCTAVPANRRSLC